MDYIFYIFALLPFYLLGAFPSGYLLAKMQNIDISKYGSGNVGATNVSRVLGAKAGLITLVLDILKGFLAAWLGYIITGSINFMAMAGGAAIAGHCISIPKVLHGGKGVATTAGVFLFIAPQTLAISFVIFLAVFFWQEIVSVASIVAVLALPLSSMLTDRANAIIQLATFAALLVTYRHKANIQRFIAGKEEKFSLRKK